MRRDVGWHLATYLVVNGLLVFVWSINGGSFWPVWILALWGIGLLFRAWHAFAGRPVTEQDVDRALEQDRSRGRHGAHARPPLPPVTGPPSDVEEGDGLDAQSDSAAAGS